MGRAPCCDKAIVKRGPWSPEEDAKLKRYIDKFGTGGNWIALPQKAGLKRCGKSCRLRWLNYLRPNIKHGEFSAEEDRIICNLYANIGSRWSIIAAQLQGRTDNDIKNYWNTKLKKKFIVTIPSISLPQRPNQAPSTKIHPQFSLFQNLSHPSPYSSQYNYLNNYTYDNLASTPSSLMNTTSTSSNASVRASPPESPYSRASASCDPIMVPPQNGFVGPVQNYILKDSVITFGGCEASCSSDIGNNQDLKAYDGNTNGYGLDEKANGSYGENSLDYDGLEEIKQLISSDSSNLNLVFDENLNKYEEKVLYY